jgi:putative phosphoesterase
VRVAIVSDIHGNRTALEAVVRDLATTSPDLVLHGGDLADGGSSPAEVVDRIRSLGWQGVLGNTDEMLARPEAFSDFQRGSSASRVLFALVEEMATWSRARLGAERLAWLGSLPRAASLEDLALVHASPETPWRSPGDQAKNAELEAVYGPLGKPVVVYGHIHRPYVRRLASFAVANAGSVGLPYDGDRRASYLLLEGREPTIRRVTYDWEEEARELQASGLPHESWVRRMLEAASPQMP